MYMPIRSRMRSLRCKLNQNIRSYLPLNLEKLLIMTVYTLSYTNINRSTLNFVKMYVIVGSQRSFIMNLIRPELSELSALELENLPYLTLFTLLHLQILTNLSNKLGHNISAHKVSDEFNYWTYQTRISGVICP